MGMFDYIRCKMPLPKPAPADVVWFQTKDVPTELLYLEKWTIEADGRLIKHGVKYEDTSDPAAKGLDRFRGMITPVDVPADDEAIAFHGDINFYHMDDKTKEFWDFTARFTDGRCVRIWHGDQRDIPPTR